MEPNCSKSVRRDGARRTCRNSGTSWGKGIAACGWNTGTLIPTLPPSFPSAFGVNSLPCAPSKKLPIHHSHGGNRLIVRAFTSPHNLQCQQALCLIHPSVPSTFLAHIVNPKGPNGGWRAAKASTTFARQTVPRGFSAPSHISFVFCFFAVSTH